MIYEHKQFKKKQKKHGPLIATCQVDRCKLPLLWV